ncbi:hypothetical protein QL285_077763 [Trifolium repens]|nr:hypothetical protein QL285_077763 [Trifolium repens]
MDDCIVDDVIDDFIADKNDQAYESAERETLAQYGQEVPCWVTFTCPKVVESEFGGTDNTDVDAEEKS